MEIAGWIAKGLNYIVIFFDVCIVIALLAAVRWAWKADKTVKGAKRHDDDLL